MSFKALAWAEQVKGVKWATKGILLLLANSHNGESGQCNPSEDRLMELTGLSGRTIRMHLKALEDAGLIERIYKHGGRGVGRSAAGFHLKIGILGAVNNEQEIATAESCHGKISSLPRQNTAKPYKEEPEKNRKYNVEKQVLDEIWSVWSKTGRRRSKAKSLIANQLKAISKSYDVELVKKAALAFARDQDPEYHPALDVWLKGRKFENWDGQADAPTVKQLDKAQWQNAMRFYCEEQTWMADFVSPAPHEPGCLAPQNMLAHAEKIFRDRGDEITANLIKSNIMEKAA